MIVEDFDRAEEAFKQLISQQKGCYVAQAEVTGSAGSPRKGHWKVRVPVEQFEAFVEAVTKLGGPQRNSIDSKDVTEEYYDLEAHIKNKKVEEQRLLKHLEKSTGWKTSSPSSARSVESAGRSSSKRAGCACWPT